MWWQMHLWVGMLKAGTCILCVKCANTGIHIHKWCMGSNSKKKHAFWWCQKILLHHSTLHSIILWMIWTSASCVENGDFLSDFRQQLMQRFFVGFFPWLVWQATRPTTPIMFTLKIYQQNCIKYERCALNLQENSCKLHLTGPTF